MSLTTSITVSLIAVILGTVDCWKPQLRVNSTVISIRESVNLSCAPPQSFRGSQTKCTFIAAPHGDISSNSVCGVSVTGTDLMRLKGNSVDTEVEIRCVFTVETGEDSFYSDFVKITINGWRTELRVNPTVISMSESIHLSCQSGLDLHGPPTKCIFQTNPGHFIKENSDCEVSFTGAELLRPGGYGPDSKIHLTCLSILDNGEPSLFSPPVKVKVTGWRTELRVNPTVISMSESVHLSCQSELDLHGPPTKCIFQTNQDRFNLENSDCEVSFTGAELLRSGGYGPDPEINITCLSILDNGEPSLFSPPVKVTVTEKDPTSKPPQWTNVIPFVITAVILTLLGLAALCLFRVRRKRNSPSEKEAPPPNNTYYETVLMGKSKKPEEAESRAHTVIPQPAQNETYSMIGDNPSAVPRLPPAGCDAKPEQGDNNKSNPDNIYFTVEASPAPVQTGTIYSLLSMSRD